MMIKRKRKIYIRSTLTRLRVRNEIRPTKAVLEARDRRRERELEAETYDPNTRLLGDPPPGRSALDQKASR